MNEIIEPYAKLASKLHAIIIMTQEAQLEVMELMGVKLGLDKDQSALLLKSISEGLK